MTAFLSSLGNYNDVIFILIRAQVYTCGESATLMSSLLLRGLQRVFVTSRQAESVTLHGRFPLQPLATWPDSIRWSSSGNKINKEESGKGKSEEKSQSQEDDVTKESEGAEAEPVGDDIDVLLQKKDDAIQEFKDKYVRSLAEMENIRQRSKKQIEEAKLYGIQGFSKDVLEVADILQKATFSVPENALKDNNNAHLISLYDGVKLTEAELQKVLKKNGVDQINPVGHIFDPVFHEAMFEVEGDKPGTVAHVMSLGYTLHGRTIRPARVGVVKQSES